MHAFLIFHTNSVINFLLISPPASPLLIFKAFLLANFFRPDDARESNLLVRALVENDLTNQYANGLIVDKSTDSHQSLCTGKLSKDVNCDANPKKDVINLCCTLCNHDEYVLT